MGRKNEDGIVVPRRAPEENAALYAQIKEKDTTRPVFVTFTSSFTDFNSRYDEPTRRRLYPEYVKAADVVGFDIYPIYGWARPGWLTQVADGTEKLVELAGHRPVYAWIETSKGSRWVAYEKQIDVEPKHTRCEVWMAVIRGATAIGYFTHAWQPSFTEFAPTIEMQEELKRINEQLTRLAPAILADPSDAVTGMRIEGELACHLKATQLDGEIYIFAQNIDLGPDSDKLLQFEPISPRGGRAVITVRGLRPGVEIEVVDENRRIISREGWFEDGFGPLQEHVYRLRL